MAEDFRKVTEKQINDEIATLGKVFSVVRLLSAEEVGAMTKDCKNKRIVGDCFEIWKSKKQCSNCIGYRALVEKKQFSKIEKTTDGLFQVIVDYREVDGKPCVIEMIKEFDNDLLVDFKDDVRASETLSEYFRKSYTDVLTDTYNRRYYEDYISNMKISGGIAMIDIDDFKIYNDLFGHSIGDAVLKETAAAIKQCVRSDDKVVRYGGDEFLLIASGIREESFMRFLGDIREKVRNVTFKDYPAIKPSVSIGFIMCSDETVKDAVNRADEFMYLAKKKKDYIVSVSDREKKTVMAFPNKERILIVDDSSLNREILSSILKNEYDIIEAEDGKQAIMKMNEYNLRLSAVLLDLMMPGMSGFDVIDYMNANNLLDNLPVIAITGDESSETKRIAYEKGVSDYITRPFDAKVVYRRVSNTIKLYSRQRRLVAEIIDELKDKEKNRSMLVEILSQVVEHPDGEDCGNHAEHMMSFTKLLLEKLSRKSAEYALSDKDILVMSTAAALHDIGKVYIDRKITDKKGPLTPEEFEVMKTHTVLGERMLKRLNRYEKEPLVICAMEICRHHHERFDGNGYPDRLKGNEISIAAQVVSLCDVYDALISKRPYKPAYSHEMAIEKINNGECGVFNPILLECFAECADLFKEIIGSNTTENYNDE